MEYEFFSIGSENPLQLVDRGCLSRDLDTVDTKGTWPLRDPTEIRGHDEFASLFH